MTTPIFSLATINNSVRLTDYSKAPSSSFIALSGLGIIYALLLLLFGCSSLDGWRLDRGTVNLAAFHDKELSPAFVKRWEVRLDTTSRFSPVVGYGRVFVGLDNGDVVAVNPTFGNVLWRYKAGGAVSNSAAVQEMKDLRTPYLWFTAEDGCLYALKAYSGTLAWKLTGTPTTWQSSVNYDVPDQLFYNYSEGVACKTRAINAVTGAIIWEGGSHNISTSIPLTVNSLDLLIQGYTDGGAHQIRASKQTDGSQQWDLPPDALIDGAYTSGLENPLWGHLFFTRKGEVICYNALISSINWRKNLPMTPVEQITGIAIKPLLQYSQGQGIIIATTNTYIFALRATDGTILWSHKHSGNVIDPTTRRTPMPAILGSLVVMVEDASVLVLRNVFDGTEVWNYRLDSPTQSSPALAAESIFIVSGAGKLYRFSHCRK